MDGAPPASVLILRSPLDPKAQVQIQTQEEATWVPPLQALQGSADPYARYEFLWALELWGSRGRKRHSAQSWRPCQACGWSCSEAATVARHKPSNLPLSLLEFSHYSSASGSWWEALTWFSSLQLDMLHFPLLGGRCSHSPLQLWLLSPHFACYSAEWKWKPTEAIFTSRPRKGIWNSTQFHI